MSLPSSDFPLSLTYSQANEAFNIYKSKKRQYDIVMKYFGNLEAGGLLPDRAYEVIEYVENGQSLTNNEQRSWNDLVEKCNYIDKMN